MELTYAELEKLALPKLKELALSIGNIHGVHSMKKDQLLLDICRVKNIVNTAVVAAEKRRQQAQKDIKLLKTESNTLRTERDEKRSELSRKELARVRRKIKSLKRKTRALAKG